MFLGGALAGATILYGCTKVQISRVRNFNLLHLCLATVSVRLFLHFCVVFIDLGILIFLLFLGSSLILLDLSLKLSLGYFGNLTALLLILFDHAYQFRLRDLGLLGFAFSCLLFVNRGIELVDKVLSSSQILSTAICLLHISSRAEE